MNLTGLHLLLSYKCTYECDHCFVHSSPRAEGTMSLAFVRDVLHQARRLGGIEDIYLEGGEPLLYYPLALNAAKEAAAMGFRVGMVSNGWFAETVEDARLWLEPFSQIEGFSLSVSADSYHGSGGGEHPLVTAAKQLGMDAGAIAIEEPCALPGQGHEKGTPILGGGVRFRGRAVHTLADDPALPKRDWESFTACPDEDFDEVGRLHLDGYGNLFVCQGVVVGNLCRQSLEEVVRRYDPAAHPVVAALRKDGPAELVRRFDLPLRGEYLDACHLCYLARMALRGRFPEMLGPDLVYGVRSDTTEDAL